MEVIDIGVIKPNSVVFYKSFLKKKYNENSKENLIQYKINNAKKIAHSDGDQSQEVADFLKFREQKEVNDINDYYNEYQKQSEKTGLFPVKRITSKQTANKITRITDVFVSTILSSFSSVRAFRQRSVSFVTLTLTEPQKHTDKFIISRFTEFIDHLKKVQNKMICPVTKKVLPENALEVKNYVWRAETQANGNIHFHIILDTFFNKDVLQRVWNKHLEAMGYTPSKNSSHISGLKKDKSGRLLKNVSAYLCKYMTKPNKNKDGSERRPIMGKVWGCSKALLSLDFPRFYDYEITMLNDLTNHPESKVLELDISLRKFITVFKMGTKKVLKDASYNLQKIVKDHYKNSFRILYEVKEVQEQEAEPAVNIYVPMHEKVAEFKRQMQERKNKIRLQKRKFEAMQPTLFPKMATQLDVT